MFVLPRLRLRSDVCNLPAQRCHMTRNQPRGYRQRFLGCNQGERSGESSPSPVCPQRQHGLAEVNAGLGRVQYDGRARLALAYT
eukprot:scaffold84408_cov33-Tisochrysis_lutea.AAC.6